MRNYITAAMSTANQIADTVNVDTTTVVRCAQSLGYTGWPELQDQLKAHALAEFQATNGAQAPKTTSTPYTPGCATSASTANQPSTHPTPI